MADQPEQLPNDAAKYLIGLNQHRSVARHPPTERPAAGDLFAGADAAGPSDTHAYHNDGEEPTVHVTSAIKSVAVPGRVSLTGHHGLLANRKSSLEQLRAQRSTDADAALSDANSGPTSTESKLESHDAVNEVSTVLFLIIICR